MLPDISKQLPTNTSHIHGSPTLDIVVLLCCHFSCA